MIKSLLIKNKTIRLREVILDKNNNVISNKIIKYFKNEKQLCKYLDKLKKNYKKNINKYYVIEEKEH